MVFSLSVVVVVLDPDLSWLCLFFVFVVVFVLPFWLCRWVVSFCVGSGVLFRPGCYSKGFGA